MHPDFFHLGPLDIHTYGVFVALGFAAGLYVATRRARAAGLDPDLINNLSLWLILAGMGGAKLFHIIFFWDDFRAGWQAVGWRSLREGFVFYGGFIGACLATIAYCRVKKLPLWEVADVFAPALALGHAFGRMGCFFNGCCFGKVCTLPWAVRFPPPHIMAGIPLHPTQLYEVAGNLAIFAGLTAFTHRRQFPSQIWWFYVLLYGALRFTVEFFRGDYSHYYFGHLTLGHLIAAGMMVIALIAPRFCRAAS